MKHLLAVLPLLLVARPAPVEIRVLVESPDGEVSERRLTEFETRGLRSSGAAWVRFSGAPVEDLDVEPDERAEISLVGGDVLRGRIADGRDEEVVLSLLGRVEVPISIEVMRSIVFPERLPLAGMAALEAPTEGDRLYRRIGDNLDRIDGAVERFDEGGVVFDSVLGSRAFLWREIGALFVETFDEGADETDCERVVCDLVDGSRLRGALEVIDRRGVRLRGPGGEVIALPTELVSEVSLDDGSVAFLSDMTPSGADEGSPFGDDLGMTWPHRMDRSVMGPPLTVGGRTFSRGIGVHAPSRLTFDLGGRWSELRGFVGIDDQVMRLPARGSVIFRIQVDGELAWESKIVRGGLPPRSFPDIDLTGANELTLECDMATELAIADRADWLRMVLVK